MRVTPSPPEGEAPQGEHPLDPLRYSFCLNRGFLVNFLMSYCNFNLFLRFSLSISIIKDGKIVKCGKNLPCPAVPRRGPEAGNSP